MYISLFWIVVIILVMAYFRQQRAKHMHGILLIIEAMQRAGVTVASADEYIDHLAFWVNQIHYKSDADNIIFSFYDQYGFTRPQYAIIDDRLRDTLKRSLAEEQYKLRKFKKTEESKSN